MAKSLLIVESPAKAKTIEKYLGKDFLVQSSYGHVRDLSKEKMGIDIDNNFAPHYVIIEEKKKIIQTLRKSCKAVTHVYLATDDDREGEAISWHLAEALKLKDSKRIVFHEITKKAISKALEAPRAIDLARVEAQQARRILDRIVGFEISPILWQKIKRGLSAGRVQSVAVRLIVERERSIKAFTQRNFFSIKAELAYQSKHTLQAQISTKFNKEEEAKAFLEQCLQATLSVAEIEKKSVKKHPAPPFTTSTLQQEASRLLGFAVGQTMRIAQNLYEAGKISYMRTDSVHLSQDAQQNAATTIQNRYGEKYLHTRQYKTRTRSAQEAHEAIRPTQFEVDTVADKKGEGKLYNLIWRRALASQMAAADTDRTLLYIAISNSKQQLLATGEVLRFDGFLRLYAAKENEGNTEANKQHLPNLKVGDPLNLLEMTATEGFSRAEPRYTEATLVRELESKGIGRPSTYAPTIETIQKRLYVEKESRPGVEKNYIQWLLKDKKINRNILTMNTGVETNKLFPTDMGMVVNDFLTKYFTDIVDYSFTAGIEEKLDEIANGNGKWQKMLEHFYEHFHPHVEKSKTLERKDVKKERVLGTDPKTGEKVWVLLGKFGPYVQLGELKEDAEKPPRASLRKGHLMEEITLEEALQLLKLPRQIGSFEEENVIANEGRYGPYVMHKKSFYSLQEEQDPLTITLETAISLIENARTAQKNKVIKTFSEDSNVQVLNGRYGPYIKFDDKNVRIPKGTDPETLTYTACKSLAEKAKPSKRKPRKN